MTTLATLAKKVRSKNAGPFWLTIDIFCDSDAAFQTVCENVDANRAAVALGADPATLKRFEIADLRVLKISVPRPTVQGTQADRDMHGASFANILAELEI